MIFAMRGNEQIKYSNIQFSVPLSAINATKAVAPLFDKTSNLWSPFL